MAGLLAASALALRGLPAPRGLQQPDPQQHSRLHSGGALLAAVVACDATAATAAAAALAVTASVCLPPRTYNHTRRLTVPTYCLAGARTRRSRSRRLGGGDDEEAGCGDGGGGGFGGGGDDGSGGPDWWGGDEGGDDGSGSAAARLQDLLVLWSLFCGLAFCQTLWHVSPKPKPAPAFAALSYSGLKAQLLRGAAPAACVAAS